LSRPSIKPKRSTAKKPTKYRLGVTVYYFEDDISRAIEPNAETIYPRRKNLRRQRQTAKGKRAGVMDRSLAKG
jgi:hypothetical protein